MKKISILGMFILFCFISCGKDSKIKEILNETHEDEIKEAAYRDPNVKKHIDGKEIVKTIIIKGKIVNIVVK